MKKFHYYVVRRSYQSIKRKKQRKYLEENNLLDEYKNSKYKTMTGFLKNRGVNIQ